VPIGLVCVPIACTAMVLTTAVALAQNDTPGLASQVAKPVITQAAAAASSGVAATHQAVANPSKAVQASGGSAQGVSPSQPVSAPKRASAVTVPAVDVPVTPPRIAVSPPPSSLPAASPAPAAPTPPEAVDVPATLAAPIEELDAVAEAEAVAASEDISPALEAADPSDAAPAVAQVEPHAVPSGISSPVERLDLLVQSAVEPSGLAAAIDDSVDEIVPSAVDAQLDNLPAALAPTDLPKPLIAPGAPISSLEPIGSLESSASVERPAPSTTGGPIVYSVSGASIAPFESPRPRPSTPETVGQTLPPASADDPAPASISTWPAIVDQERAHPGSIVAVANRPFPQQLVRSPDALVPGNQRRPAQPLEMPAHRAFSPAALLVGPNTAPALTAPQPHPAQKPLPFEPAPPPGAAASPATNTSSLLVGSGGAPGAMTPLHLSLVLLAAWRSLLRHGTTHPASIALPNLAPPG
jgi:hypothetical protein